jgi:thiol-disulfide isomerase/thioredoxin
MTSLQKFQMTPLPDQELFEAMMLKSTDERLPVVPKKIVVWFSASWCGPCKRVDGAELVQSFPDVSFYKCDVDENNYTPGYCGVKSIPAFLALSNGKILGQYQNSTTEYIVNWVREVFKEVK